MTSLRVVFFLSCILCNPLTVIYVELLDGGGYPNQGRVSLYYDGQWGTVCDDQWDINDAHVVCRMLGYPKALGFTSQSAFGGAQDGPIWMDEVNCTGSEDTLAACPHYGWGNSDCDHTEDAGVICDFNYTVDAKGKKDAKHLNYEKFFQKISFTCCCGISYLVSFVFIDSCFLLS